MTLAVDELSIAHDGNFLPKLNLQYSLNQNNNFIIDYAVEKIQKA
jgi:hypothetical protein